MLLIYPINQESSSLTNLFYWPAVTESYASLNMIFHELLLILYKGFAKHYYFLCLFRFNLKKLTYEERKARLVARLQALNSAAGAGDDDDDEEDDEWKCFVDAAPHI